MTTYSLAEAATLICGRGTRAETEWTAVRLRRGEFSGYKAGRKWRMTQADVDAAIEALRPKTIHVPPVPAMKGLTRTSARRLAS